MCIVWSPIPLISWILPFVGHLGISLSEGEIQDFGGPYYINRSYRRTAFGSVSKYYKATPSDLRRMENPMQDWDSSVQKASTKYEGMMHNLFCNNCHDHVAAALNPIQFRGYSHWNTLLLILFMMKSSSYVSFGRFLQTYLPAIVIYTLIIVAIFFL